MQFFKMKHIHTTKLVKYDDSYTYGDYLALAKAKFPELGEKLYFTDMEGTILEEDILVDFVKASIGIPSFGLIVATLRPYPTEDETASDISNTSTISIISLEPTDEISEINELENELLFKKPTAPAKVLNTPEDWKYFINQRMGLELFEFYEKNKFLSNSLRIKLVNTTCAGLIERYGIRVPEEAKHSLGNAIVSLFPNLKDPAGQTGYEAFYRNHNGGEGYIAWRLRTVGRSSKDEKIRSQIHKRKRSLDREIITEGCKKQKCNNSDLVTRDVLDAIEFMKNACPKNDVEAIKAKMTVTHEYKKIVTDVLETFPRFLDTPSLIEHDFRLDFPNVVDFESVFTAEHAKILLSVYESTTTNPDKNLLSSDNEEDSVQKYDLCTRALLAILRMLPAIRKKKSNKDVSIENRLIVFKKINQPVSEVLDLQSTCQPYLLAQGTNKGAIAQYHIVIEKKLLPCPKLCSSAKAFETLFMAFYTFNLRYDDSLKSFWEFIQTYYFNIDCDSVVYTPKMSELRTRLAHSERE